MFRILIVEDDRVISGMMKKHLEKWGYEVETVTDFANILPHFSGFGPHLVLMDIGLPYYNGYYWCAEIRKFSPGSGDFHFICRRQYEYRDGHEYGGRRFYRQTL